MNINRLDEEIVHMPLEGIRVLEWATWQLGWDSRQLFIRCNNLCCLHAKRGRRRQCNASGDDEVYGYWYWRRGRMVTKWDIIVTILSALSSAILWFVAIGPKSKGAIQ